MDPGTTSEGEVCGQAEKRKPRDKAEEKEEQVADADKAVQIPLHRWVMHGAVMFGREFCYAMETALVTPVLLQIGLPEQYYSLTWFLSPVLGLLFTPLMGSASDQCTLSWGRRRPFILALCVGVLLGVALFLNGSLIGLSIGDRPGSQPLGIVLTIVGVVVLDFCADASEGPIRAYLLDVVDTEEQDMALNIHAFSAGLGGALGYILGGLDWTGTALGQAFKAQEQVLFLFSAIIFIVSVVLHMISIPEQPLVPSGGPAAGTEDSTRNSFFKDVEHVPALLDVIQEEDGVAPLAEEENDSIYEDAETNFLSVDRVRSKSDSALAMPDSAIELDSDLDPDSQLFLPDSQEELEEVFKPQEHSAGSLSPSGGLPPLTEGTLFSEPANSTSAEPNCRLQNNDSHQKTQKVKAANGVFLSGSDHAKAVKGHVSSSSRVPSRPSSGSVTSRPHSHTYYRRPSFTFSYYGRVGSQRSRRRCSPPLSPQPITASRSLNDLSHVQQQQQQQQRRQQQQRQQQQQRLGRRELQLSVSSLSSQSGSSHGGTDGATTLKQLWLSMMRMPRQLWRLCLCHLLTWFSITAESVFYTDFMGQVIYHGDPTAPANSTELHNYSRGVQMGCWGLVGYAAISAVCSAILQKYLDNFDLSIKVIYIVGTLAFAVGTAVMAIFPDVYVSVIMISSMGIISMSISYCPYALLAQYFEIKEYVHHSPANTKRGFGIDCAILSCQVYISQILVASALGAVVQAVGSVRVIPAVAAVGSFLGFLTALFLVIYPDVEASSSEQDQDSAGSPGDSDPSRETLALLDLRDEVTLVHSVA